MDIGRTLGTSFGFAPSGGSTQHSASLPDIDIVRPAGPISPGSNYQCPPPCCFDQIRRLGNHAMLIMAKCVTLCYTIPAWVTRSECRKGVRTNPPPCMTFRPLIKPRNKISPLYSTWQKILDLRQNDADEKDPQTHNIFRNIAHLC